MITTTTRRERVKLRHGMSVVEFLGCVSALAGGLVLGSICLGVNVKDMAYVVLEQARIVEPRITNEKSTKEPAASPQKPVDASDATTTASGDAPATVPAESTTTDVGGESSDAAPPGAAPQPSATTSATPPPPATPSPVAGLFAREDLITPEQRQVLTLAYWDALAVCMDNEQKQRVPAIDEDGNWQLFDYLTGRKDGHVKAATAISNLDPRGVDDHVMAYAKKAHAWHEDGARLFGRAVDLLTDAPTAQLSGPFAQSWQSSATQHRMEARLLAEKQEAVRTYLSHAYESTNAADGQAEK